MTTDNEIAARRMVDLIKWYGDATSKKRGWQRRFARKIEVHPSYVSRLLSGSLTSIGPDVVARAAERLPIKAEYFAQKRSVPPIEYIPTPTDAALKALDEVATAGFTATDSSVDLMFAAFQALDALQTAEPLAQQNAKYLELAARVLGWRVVRLAQEVQSATPANLTERGVTLASVLAADIMVLRDAKLPPRRR